MEWLGIAGTLFIILAFTMNGERKIRVLDLIGALLFVIYGSRYTRSAQCC